MDLPPSADFHLRTEPLDVDKAISCLLDLLPHFSWYGPRIHDRPKPLSTLLGQWALGWDLSPLISLVLEHLWVGSVPNLE
jgi:hypothetical protein